MFTCFGPHDRPGFTRIRRTQEGCGGLGGENPAAFPKAGPIFQQTFSLPENAQTLAGIDFALPENHGIIFQQRQDLPENFSSNEFRTATAFSSFLKEDVRERLVLVQSSLSLRGSEGRSPYEQKTTLLRVPQKGV